METSTVAKLAPTKSTHCRPRPMPSSPNFVTQGEGMDGGRRGGREPVNPERRASLELVTSRALRSSAEPSQRNAPSRLFFLSTKAPSPVAVTDSGGTYTHTLQPPPASNLLFSRIYQVIRSLLAQKTGTEPHPFRKRIGETLASNLSLPDFST